jgi:hypothetical protein
MSPLSEEVWSVCEETEELVNDITLGVFEETGDNIAIKKLHEMTILINTYVERYRSKIDVVFLASTERWDPLTSLLIKCYLLKQGFSGEQ